MIQIPFRIHYPLNILSIRKVDFSFKENKKEILSRNIYYYLFEESKNSILQKNIDLFLDIGDKVNEYILQMYPSLEVLSISLFGSSIFDSHPEDYDFLVIVIGNVNLFEEPIIKLKGQRIQTGLSIKGIENFTNGFKRPDNTLQSERTEAIINRTAISLFKRHIPLIGRDFIKNEEEFKKNILALVSDLLFNSYELFYLKNKRIKIPNEKRAGKILKRCYEAISYLGLLYEEGRIISMRKKIYFELTKKYSLNNSKKIFKELHHIYKSSITSYSG